VYISDSSVSALNGFFETSDARLKCFMEDVKVDFDGLKSIPKKYFVWKNDDKKKIHIGTSAQEVQKLYPELVTYDEEGTLSMSYDKLSIIALKGIDDLYDMITELKEENKKLKETIQALL
jgi:hypothetical protein